MIESYLLKREPLKLALMLVDSRIHPTESDRMLKTWLDYHRIPNAVVLTKIDKLTRNDINRALRTGVQTLNTKEIIAFSAVTGYGKDQILDEIRSATE